MPTQPNILRGAITAGGRRPSVGLRDPRKPVLGATPSEQQQWTRDWSSRLGGLLGLFMPPGKRTEVQRAFDPVISPITKLLSWANMNPYASKLYQQVADAMVGGKASPQQIHAMRQQMRGLFSRPGGGQTRAAAGFNPRELAGLMRASQRMGYHWTPQDMHRYNLPGAAGAVQEMFGRMNSFNTIRAIDELVGGIGNYRDDLQRDPYALEMAVRMAKKMREGA